jgi:hypothetical protein
MIDALNIVRTQFPTLKVLSELIPVPIAVFVSLTDGTGMGDFVRKHLDQYPNVDCGKALSKGMMVHRYPLHQTIQETVQYFLVHDLLSKPVVVSDWYFLFSRILS